MTDRFALFALGSAPNETVAKSWLARFGRTAAQHVLDAVQERMTAPRTAGVQGTLAGRSFRTQRGGAPEKPVAEHRARDELDTLLLRMDAGLAGADDEFRAEPRSLTARELFTGASAFALTGGTDEGRSVALWGRGARSGFGGREGEAEIDGEVTTATLGADWAFGRTTAGLALSHSEGDGTWRQDGREDEIESSLTGLHPYFGYEVTDRLSVWGVAGHGRGEVTMPDGARTIRADIDMTMAAAGARSDLTPRDGASGMALAVEVDGLFLRIGSDATEGLEELEADVSRLRLGVEGSRAIEMETGETLRPHLEIGLRHDGGDAETGVGVDIGGGLAFADLVRGLSASLNARRLLVHEAEGFEDWGVSGAFTLDPDPSSKRGLSMSLRHSVGSVSSVGADTLFGRETLTGLAADGNAEPGERLDAEAAYGFLVLGGRFTGTPHAGFGLSETGRDYTLGWRLAPAHPEDLDLSFDIDGTRHERANGGDPDHGVALRFKLRW